MFMLQTKLNFWTKYNKIVLGPIRYKNCAWSDSSGTWSGPSIILLYLVRILTCL